MRGGIGHVSNAVYYILGDDACMGRGSRGSRGSRGYYILGDDACWLLSSGHW